MPQGTLANLANSAFVRTPPAFAARIVRSLLSFPTGKATNILDPTAGEGDLVRIPLRRRGIPMIHRHHRCGWKKLSTRSDQQ